MAVILTTRTLAFGETLIIPETNLWLWNRSWSPVLQTAGRAKIEILGQVAGQSYGIDTDGPRNTILIGPEGGVSARFTTVKLDGRGDRLVNHGSISGGTVEANGHDVLIRNTGTITDTEYRAITLDATRKATIRNEGWIEASSYGIQIDPARDAEAALHSIVNSGTIFGRSFGITASSYGRAQITLDNQGTLIGRSATVSTEVVAFRAAERGVDRVTNAGRIFGVLELGGSDDRYESLGRGRIEGRVYGGDGEDTLLGNGGNEWLNGDSGDDLIRGGGRDTLDEGQRPAAGRRQH